MVTVTAKVADLLGVKRLRSRLALIGTCDDCVGGGMVEDDARVSAPVCRCKGSGMLRVVSAVLLEVN